MQIKRRVYNRSDYEEVYQAIESLGLTIRRIQLKGWVGRPGDDDPHCDRRFSSGIWVTRNGDGWHLDWCSEREISVVVSDSPNMMQRLILPEDDQACLTIHVE